MNTFEMIQHPLDWVSLTGSMAGLDEIGRDSADQLMTMIGDMQFCKGDIRGTCARYFFFIDTEWFCKLCRAANIDCRKLQNYLLTIEKEAASGLDEAFDDPQASFRFPRNEEQPKDGLYAGSGSQPEIRSEILSENHEASDTHHCVEGPTIQKPAPKSIRVWNKMERFGYR